MKIILSPAKTLALTRPVTIDGQTENMYLPSNTTPIMDVLKVKSLQEIQKLLKLSDSLLEENWEYIQHFDDAIAYRAIDMYQGMVYQALNYESLSQRAKDYIEEHVLILSALYGVIKPCTLIKPYRLDFNTNVKIQGKSLKKYWTEQYNSSIPEEETILNLASNEFSQLFNKTRFDWHDFDFFKYQGKIKKRHSTIAKKNRGLLLRDLAINNVEKIEDIKELKNYGICYSFLD